MDEQHARKCAGGAGFWTRLWRAPRYFRNYLRVYRADRARPSAGRRAAWVRTKKYVLTGRC